MNLFISKLKSNKLVKNSFIFFLGSITVSIGNYIFHLVLGRLLGPKEYGVLASLISLSAILAIPTATIGLVSIKLASNIKVTQNYGKLHFFIKYFLKRLVLGGILFLIISSLFAPVLSSFLKISSPGPIFLLYILIFISFLIPVTRGSIQGLQMFKALTLNMILEPIIKIGVAIPLVVWGWKVWGALGAMVISALVVFLASFKPLWFTFRFTPQNKIKISPIFSYALPVFISLFCFTLLYNIDIILVKHFFEEKEAGLYSALTKLGQIIFFGTSAIGAVMFPMVAEKYKKGENYTGICQQSLLIVGGLSAFALLFYFLFPEILIKMLFGSSYLAIAPLLGWFAFSMLFLSLNNILINYYLSIHKFKFIYILGAVTFLEIFLISFYHNSMTEIVINILISLGVLFIGLFTLFFLQNKKLFSPTNI